MRLYRLIFCEQGERVTKRLSTQPSVVCVQPPTFRVVNAPKGKYSFIFIGSRQVRLVILMFY
jgi:hypothetical protein